MIVVLCAKIYIKSKSVLRFCVFTVLTISILSMMTNNTASCIKFKSKMMPLKRRELLTVGRVSVV